jgi:NAD(P)-dependent dehydrogenase (short-subunit alcohol dehydrogenase family)
MATSLPLRGRLAVVTGAGSGIGRALSLELARRGMALALADVDAAGLAGTATQAQGLGASASMHRLDVADREAVADLPGAVRAAHGGTAPAVVANVAGVALGGTFETTSEADFDWLMRINFDGVVRMTRAFLPLLREAQPAQLVNVSSLYGLIAPAGQTAYSASKFAVRGFSNALRRELKGSGVGVTVVHPGGVATNIAKRARMSQSLSPDEIAQGQKTAERFLRMPPDQAGRIIADGLERRAARVIVGADARVLSWVERLFPVDQAGLLDRMMPARR